eukprot:Tamp_35861.p2 GENE.Tamp_35861~~Tamp_35861.p2  ORF type:complete len:165 (+),score=54.08 Tamp_35861:56-496(+)
MGAGARQMSSLEGTKTLQNLREAFAGESLARARYLFFAQRADVEGYSEVAAAFRQVAASEEAQAMGHLEWLQEFGDPVSNQPMGSTKENLNCAIVGETHDADVLNAEAAKTAKAEGLEDAAYWFETVQGADTQHKNRFAKALKEVP